MSGSFMQGFIKGVAEEERKKLEALKAVNSAQGGLMTAISSELNRKTNAEQIRISNEYRQKEYDFKLKKINKEENDKLAELKSFKTLTEAYKVPIVANYLNSGGKDVGRAMQLFKSEIFKQGKVPGMPKEAWSEMNAVLNNPKSAPTDIAKIGIKFGLDTIPSYVAAAEKGKETAAANAEKNKVAIEAEQAKKIQDNMNIKTAQDLMMLKKIRETQDPALKINEISNEELDRQISVLQTNPAVANMLRMTQSRIKDVNDNKEKIVKATQAKEDRTYKATEEVTNTISELVATFKGTGSDPIALLMKIAASKAGMSMSDKDNENFKGAVGIQRKALLYKLRSRINRLSGLTGNTYKETFEKELRKIVEQAEAESNTPKAKAQNGSGITTGTTTKINSQYGLPK